ncbi:o-succinylbenzoate synthase [Halobacillus andaensis]|uniref:o-succinylbenzoate synthase n=1 Tax=Halobacillus andaensis TaxID=1176239 RepID=A0A917F0L7_HALAA|nr:o-succinylbenzoate synthase [Halobacillus andaensis]MBP2005621.1 O-succinylbenzoate synthase [Halobacillus andaensis]GGF32940.1 o-succinylbenzoate synthase [Halobacillus andaensis]
MNISKLTLNEITIPLKAPFQTHSGKLSDRSVIIISIEDTNGIIGYGEVTAFSIPFYTSETIHTAWHILKDICIPSLNFEKMTHPSEFSKDISFIKGNQMAKAGVEGALWDLYAKQLNLSLSKMIGGVQKNVKAGAVLSLTSHLSTDVAQLQESGYERFKLKVEKGKEEETISYVRDRYPDLPLMIDANGMYNAEDIPRLKRLEQYDLEMIEQPFRTGDFYLHQQLQQEVTTPICLDESIQSYQDAVQAIAMDCCRSINIKISRVGGLTEAIRIHDYCKEHQIPVWCGGMVETGVSKAHNVALASLSNFTIPGDLSHSTRYLEEDIIQPYIKVKQGRIEVPKEAGIGYEVNRAAVARLTNRQWNFYVN